MKDYIPHRYYRNIFDINYNKLKGDNIKCLLFDLDNTLAPVNVKTISDEYIDLFNELKKDFRVIIISNALPFRTKRFANMLGVNYKCLAWKPHKFSYCKLIKKNGFKNDEVVTIGDQIFTDIKGAYNSGIKGILVDPISSVDSLFTKRNRKKENKYMNSSKLIRRGEYYE